MSHYEMLGELMFGRIAMQAREAELVEKYAARCDTWLEIGTLWGGSALLALSANPLLTLTCIDPMIGYYGEERDSWDAKARMPSLQAFWANMELFGVRDRVRLIVARSQPFPLPGLHVDGVLIDGSHDPEDVAADVRSAQDIAYRFILCHDIDDGNVNLAVEQSMDWEAWREGEASECMRVFERRAQ